MALQRIDEFLWQSMPEGREKYAAYLCSPQWARLRLEVLSRNGNVCERCGVHPAENVHHLTYIRKYNERLEDLAAWCRGCHEWNHNPSLPDPKDIQRARLRLPRALWRALSTGPDKYSDEDTESRVQCPYCGCCCCHIEKPEYVTESEDGEQGRVTIPTSCETGNHQWDTVFAGHEGTLLAFTRNCRNRIDECDQYD